MSIRSKLMIPMVVIVVFVIASYVFLLHSFTGAAERAAFEQNRLNTVVDQIGRADVSARDAILTRDDRHLVQAAEAALEVHAALDELEDGLPGEVEAFRVPFEVYFTQAISITSLFDEQRTEEARGRLGALEANSQWLSEMLATFSDAVLERQRRQQRDTVFLGLLAGLAVVSLTLLLLLSFVPRYIIMPVKTVVAKLAEVAEGAGDLTKQLPIHTRDEIGELAQSFNNFTGKLEEIIRTVRHSVDALGEASRSLETQMQDSSQRLDRVAGAIETANQEMDDQSSGISESSGAVSHIASTIETLDSRIEEQAASINESSSSIEQMVANIKSVTANLEQTAEAVGTLEQAAEGGKGSLSSMVELVNRIAAESEGLLEANNIIREIAGQTNLLSMNAAIEAAHAGEHGKGFAVVADEIRRLAETTAERSGEISTVLESVKHRIDTMVESSQEAEQAFENVGRLVGTVGNLQREVKHAMEEQSSGSEEILAALNRMNTITTEVRDGSTEMRSAGGAIADEMQRLVTISESLRNRLNEIATTTREVDEMVRSAYELAGSNMTAVDQISDRLGRFTLHEHE